jgi:nitrite reductase [NAD(P)H] large subunit
MGQAKHVDGSMKSGIFGFRSLENCGRMAEYAHGKKRAAVIGGGLLGLECAHGLLSLGLEVHVMHRSSHLMNQQLDPAAGRDPSVVGGEKGRPRASRDGHGRRPC